MFKKWSIVLTSLVLVLSSFGFVVAPAFAKGSVKEGQEAGKTESITAGKAEILAMGMSGISMPKSGFQGELDVMRQMWSQGLHLQPMKGVTFSQVLTWNVENTKENAEHFLQGRSYVFFNLTRSQESQWKSGSLGIYSYNPATKTWTRLPAFAVRGTTNRIAAVATRFGTYALGLK